MLIQNLSLKNFKCFEEVDVAFAPITLLTGANSSGKSSLIYSLLAVLQTEQFPFYLSPNGIDGEFINLGSFEEMAFTKRKEDNFGIAIAIEGGSYKNSYKTTWIRDSESSLPSLRKIDYEDSFQKYQVNQDGVFSFSFKGKFDDKDISVFLSLFYNEHISYSNDILSISGRTNDSVESTISEYKNILSQISKRKMFGHLISMDEIGGDIIKSKMFNYIGSFRLPPERFYPRVAKAKHIVRSNGSGFEHQIIEWEERNPKKIDELSNIIQAMELFDKIKPVKIIGGQFDLKIKIKSNSNWASLTDVGFGISQFLPIIVADLQLDNNSCLALSQPEIHLHPKIQALFGNFLANQIKRTQKQYIVETHSEYLLNRIRLLLVTGELQPKDVCVYYFENDGIKTTTHKVEFTTDGQIKNAPESFFDTYAVDVMDIAMNSFSE